MTKPLTPVSQKQAVDRYRDRLEERGLMATSVIVPKHRYGEIHDMALLMRIEHEQEPTYETK